MHHQRVHPVGHAPTADPHQQPHALARGRPVQPHHKHQGGASHHAAARRFGIEGPNRHQALAIQPGGAEFAPGQIPFEALHQGPAGGRAAEQLLHPTGVGVEHQGLETVHRRQHIRRRQGGRGIGKAGGVGGNGLQLPIHRRRQPGQVVSRVDSKAAGGIQGRDQGLHHSL